MWRRHEPADHLQAAVIAHLRQLPPSTLLRWNDADVIAGIVDGDQVDIALEPVCWALGLERVARVLTPDAALHAGPRGPLDIVLAHNALLLTDDNDPFRRVSFAPGDAPVPREGERLSPAWTTDRISAQLDARITSATRRRDLPVVWDSAVVPTDVRIHLGMLSRGHAEAIVAHAFPLRGRALSSDVHGGARWDPLSHRAGPTRGPRPGMAS